VLSDDIVILRRHDEHIALHGTPFYGTDDPPEMARVNASAPLLALFAPVKATRHAVEPMGAVDVVARLMTCAPFLHGDRNSLTKATHSCMELAQTVPVHALHFRKDNDFWRVIDDAYGLPRAA
jgi:hypothetical protein